jgi:hypothetical protein
MTLKKILATAAVAIALVCTGFSIAQAPPVENINPHRNPNLAAAQRLIDQAFGKISDAQRANEFDMDGHAQKAKELLDQAARELKAAAAIADHKK